MKKPREGKKGQPDWLATYSDMITLLMCFFVLLFAMSSVDAEKFQALMDSFGGRQSVFPGASGDIIGDLGSGFLQVDVPDIPVTDTDEVQEYDYVTMDEAAARAMEEARQREELLGTMASEFKTYFAEHDITEAEISVDVGDSGEYVSIIFKDGILFDSGRAHLRPDAVRAIDIASDILIHYANHFIRVEGHTDNVPQRGEQYPSNRHLSAARAATVVEYLINNRGFASVGLSAEGMSEYWPIAANDTPEGRSANRRVEIKVYARQVESGIMIPVR
jgi:chemotaxis protein MotB